MANFVTIEELRKDRGQSLKSIKKELVTRRRLEIKGRKEKGILQIVKRKRSIGGRIGGVLEKTFQVGRRGITRSLYDREQPIIPGSRKTVITKTGGVKTGRRGRPRGTYDPRYAKWGGIYGYRKAIAQRNRLERIQALRSSAVTPRQQQVLQIIESRQKRQQMSQEAQVIPNTSGQVPLSGIMNEINVATNLVD